MTTRNWTKLKIVFWLFILWSNGTGVGDTESWIPWQLFLVTSAFAAWYIYEEFKNGWK